MSPPPGPKLVLVMVFITEIDRKLENGPLHEGENEVLKDFLLDW